MKSMPRSSTPASRAYLLAYNALQLVGWTWVLFCTIGAVVASIGRSARGGGGGSGGGGGVLSFLAPTQAPGPAAAAAAAAYAAAGPAVRACQGAALIETVHVVLGLVPGSPALAFLQWFGRSNVLFLILGAIPRLASHPAVLPLFLAWSGADVARYAWYATSLALPPGTPPPSWLTWLRYSAFIPLYPLGIFAGEMPLISAGLPYIEAARLHSVTMPNPLNIAFDYATFCRLGLYVLLPAAFVVLYGYLLGQRKRRLGGRGGDGGGGGRARRA
jgi:very-long-chain (3R)-3-hydroxyacyl-CoA dehydratase